MIEQEGLVPDLVILGEPTDLNVYRGQRGRMEITVSVPGKAAHGAHCDRGDNAIYRMAAIVKDVERLHQELPHDALLGKGSVTASKIESTAPSLCSVADECTLYLDRRLTRGETAESALAEIRSLPGVRAHNAAVSMRAYRGTSWTGEDVRQEAYFPAWVLDDDHPLVQTALAAGGDVNPVPPTLGVWTFSTNGVATMGRHGIPTIGYAPAREEDAHSTRENVAVADLVTATHFYARAIELLTVGS
jgi:putative selenium metabolism hydrolase